MPSMQYEVTFPAECLPGDVLTVKTEGGKVSLEVPADLPADRTFHFQGPTPREDWRPRRPVSTKRTRRDPLPPRRTVLQKAWKRDQIVAFVVYFLLAGFFWLFYRPLQHTRVEAYLGYVFASSHILVFWVALVFLSADPRDPGGAEAEVRCSMCKAPVRDNTKHCFECEECIVGFDHHCPYLNTCVGSRNYKIYLCLIWFWWFTVVFFVAQGVAMSWRLFAEQASLSIVNTAILVQASLSLLLAALALPLVGTATYLVGLHGYLVCTGMTTYYYWMQRSPVPVRAQALTETFNTVHTGATELSAGGLWSRPAQAAQYQRALEVPAPSVHVDSEPPPEDARAPTSSCAALSGSGAGRSLQRVSWNESCVERSAEQRGDDARSNSRTNETSRSSRGSRGRRSDSQDQLTARRLCRQTSTTTASAISVVSSFLMAPLASDVPFVDAPVEPLEADREEFEAAARDQLLANGVSDLTACEGPAATHVPRGSPRDAMEDGD